MVPCFVSLDGNADFRLDDPLTLVGRCPTCEVCLERSRVSRRHCCLASGHGEVLVLDLGSTNGTRINGRLVCSFDSRSFNTSIDVFSQITLPLFFMNSILLKKQGVPPPQERIKLSC